MDRMLVIVPTRSRPANVRRLWRAWLDTGATADLFFLVDDDDPELPAYIALGDVVRETCPPDVTVGMARGPRRRIGPLLNAVAPDAATAYDLVGFMGDDHVPRTVGWDQRIRDAAGPFAVVYGNDLLQGAALPTAVFMGSQLIRHLGYFNPRGCDHLYLDNAWLTYGRALGTLVYLDDVIIEHMHPVAGKADEDPLYREVNDPGMYAHDAEAYRAWAETQAATDLRRVREAMEEWVAR